MIYLWQLIIPHRDVAIEIALPVHGMPLYMFEILDQLLEVSEATRTLPSRTL